MRKKTLTVILTLCIAMTVTACGGNADTTEVEKTMAAEESTEADVPEEVEAEAPTVDEETVEPEQIEDEASADEEPFEEIEIGTDASVGGDEFYTVEQSVIDTDKSSEYGIYSASCFDIEQYLDEDGYLPGYDNYEDKMYFEYSGRWAYPKLTPCRFFTDMVMQERTDDCEVLAATDDATGCTVVLIIHSGYSYYDSMANLNYDGAPSFMFTAQTADGEAEVISERFNNPFTVGDDGEPEIQYIYYFKLGGFSVSVYSIENELSEEEVQMVIDNIRLTNSMEH